MPNTCQSHRSTSCERKLTPTRYCGIIRAPPCRLPPTKAQYTPRPPARLFASVCSLVLTLLLTVPVLNLVCGQEFGIAEAISCWRW